MVTPTDPLFAQQWHLGMLGNIRRVWDDYTGRGVTAVVYDDGLQFTHSDLAGNYNAAMHFKYNGTTYSPAPLAADDAHGTACAGLLGAVKGNGRGGVGVAYDVTLTGLNYLQDLQDAYNWDTQTTSAFYDAVMRWAARFDIMSNSWGVDPTYADELNLNIPGNSAAVDAEHFGWVSAHGRGGLGTVVLKAAGNETMNANGDGVNASRHTITVAATESTGFAADYSNYGACILVTAPAAAVTTDLLGGAGYNSTTDSSDGDTATSLDYTNSFNGTSAATPVVSGVVALMLDANSSLGWRDVQTILAMSASHTGSAVGANSSATEAQAWQVMGGKHWNGGGNIFSQSYGFGMVDAFAAVRMAEAWSRMNGPADTSANEVHVSKSMSQSSVAIADSDGSPATDEALIAFNVTNDIVIDTIYVTLDVSHGRSSDLEFYLVGPDGTYMTLFFREGGTSAVTRGAGWTFGAEAYRGQSSKGTWYLAVDDAAAGRTGTVWDARLDFYGTANSVNDVYHFTDDFQMMRALQSSRGTLRDSNGGIDWLDFAAVTKALNITMSAGGSVKLNGVQVARVQTGADVFERVQAGDGADWIAGNTLANLIYGARGNDKIAGGGGNDAVHGGTGADTLYGSSGADKLYGETGSDVLTGGTGADQFVFGHRLGLDRVADWENNVDTLVLDDAIWGGGKTVGQVLASYAHKVGGSVVLSFNASHAITLTGLTSISSLADDLTII